MKQVSETFASVEGIPQELESRQAQADLLARICTAMGMLCVSSGMKALRLEVHVSDGEAHIGIYPPDNPEDNTIFRELSKAMATGNVMTKVDENDIAQIKSRLRSAVLH